MPIWHPRSAHACSWLSCSRARLEIVLGLLVLTKLLPFDRVLGGHIKGLVKDAAVDGARHAIGTEVEVTEFFAGIVSFLAQYHMTTARLAHVAGSCGLHHCSLCISPQLSVALRIEPDCVSLQAREIGCLAQATDHAIILQVTLLIVWVSGCCRPFTAACVHR